MTKTFGTIRRDGMSWIIEAQPDVMMRLKRIFPRVQASSLGSIGVLASAEVSRDLEWVMDRWPLNISGPDARVLAAEADEHRHVGDQVTKILSGDAKHAEMPMTPARAMRDYQQKAYDMLDATGSLLLADELGLGKTQSGLSLLTKPENRPALAVTLNGLQRQWIRELNAVFPDLCAVEAKTTKPYDLADAAGNEPDLIVMNYAKMAGWADHLAGQVRTVIFDEVQELRHSGTKKHMAAQQIANQATKKAALSATPVYNFGGEMHSILSVINPGLVGDQQEFSREWCKTYGLDRKTRIVEPDAFRHWMTDQGVFLRRTRENVGVSMPDLNIAEYPVDVDDQRWSQLLETSDMAKIAELVLSDDTDHRSRWRASGDLDYKMRQATGVAKAPGVASIAKLVLESEDKIILAGWHRECWDLWAEQLAEYHPVLYTGTESTAGKRRSFEEFVDGDSRILMISLRSGAGLDGLQGVCRVALFGELDWSPGVHKQLLGRLHRPGQTQPVTGYFCVSDYGSDPAMLDALDLKKIEADLLVNGPSEMVEDIDPAAQKNRLHDMAARVIRDSPRPDSHESMRSRTL